MSSEGEKRVYLALYLNKQGLHMRELSRLSKLTLPAVAKHLKAGETEGTIISERKGNLRISRLNFGNPKLVPVLQATELERLKRLPGRVQDSIDFFISDLKEKPLISLVFGSYATGSYTGKSDLDILLVFQRIDGKLTRDIENSSSKARGRTMMSLHPVSMGYDEFEREFLNKENEFMRDVRVSSLVLQGLGLYLNILGRFHA